MEDSCLFPSCTKKGLQRGTFGAQATIGNEVLSNYMDIRHVSENHKVVSVSPTEQARTANLNIENVFQGNVGESRVHKGPVAVAANNPLRFMRKRGVIVYNSRFPCRLETENNLS